MKKMTLITILAAALPLIAHATPGIKITTESLDKAVGEIESTYRITDDLSADFTQTTFIAVTQKNISNAGSLKWKKPGKFFIDYRGERPKQYISNDKKMWIYIPGDTQVEVYNVSDKTISKEVLEFIRGFTDLRKNYSITGWQKTGKRTDLTLVPLYEGAPFAQLKCQFRTDHILDQVTIYNVTGNISTYKFSNIRINTGLPDTLFDFVKPKGVKAVSAN